MVVYQNDHIGTPQKITAVNGAVVWAAKYDSFGKATIDVSSTIENNLRFAGQYEDSETGLYYNYNRYYNSFVGRYLSIDSLSIKNKVNYIYIYTSNNPVNSIDPKGLWHYKGYCRYISGGEVVGVGLLRCKAWTKCRSDNTREVGEVVAFFGGATLGLPAGITYYNMTLDDEAGQIYPTLDRLSGSASVSSISGAAGFGYYFYMLKLGHARENACGWQAGLDLSLDIFPFGFSYLDGKPKTECCHRD